MIFDVASQAERMVSLLDGHPVASVCIGIGAFILMGSQKDGLFSKWVGYLQAKAEKEAALETRRIEIISMLENRRQPSLPGLETEEGDVQ